MIRAAFRMPIAFISRMNVPNDKFPAYIRNCLPFFVSLWRIKNRRNFEV